MASGRALFSRQGGAIPMLPLLLVLLASLLHGASSQSPSAPNPELGDQLQKQFPFCIADGQKDQDNTFFNNLNPAITNCRKDTYNGRSINRLDGAPFTTPPVPPSDPPIAGRLCTKGEIAIWLNASAKAVPTVPMILSSDNCQPLSGNSLDGCKPGFASWTKSPNVLLKSTDPVVRQDLKSFESRSPTAATYQAMACCAGYFCPENLACMIPCPKGAYCPRLSSIVPDPTDKQAIPHCTPYEYPAVLFPGQPYMCGGAATWNLAKDERTQDGIFCDSGSFCEDATTFAICPKSKYCRKGSIKDKPCSPLASCKSGEYAQGLKAAGVAFVVILLVILGVTYYLVDYLQNLRLEQIEKRRMLAEQQSRARALARERWQRAGRKIISAIRQQVRRQQPRPPHAPTQSQDLYGQASSRPAMGGNLYGGGDLYGGAAPNGGDLYGAEAGGDLYGNAAGGDLYGASGGARAPPAQVEMSKRNGRVDYADVYEELARQNQNRTAEETVLDQILNTSNSSGVRKIRVQLELEFREVNLFLKSNGRKLLDNISGVLKPGRVTAVMGPSGAGKSMFLTAVAGKETYCNMTGEVLINGQAGNIQAYKRIIGFVPQDDIVHGNLTVEENLWFSANYRLPRGMSKRSKVLIVERTLLSLGIDHIRHSRVGTVEQRGISGGQRKRVNVGLEMVIDPSLLILDEPTSGLDSTSSFKVLQALRQEAFRGVNIGVVLHQPSYKLFHMFHDVMFLMPGGKVVYLGPVRQAEQYFESLGFPVPDRINPPDHYMDVLGGEVTSTIENFDVKRLPELWLETQGGVSRQSSLDPSHVSIPIDKAPMLEVNQWAPPPAKKGAINAAETFTTKLVEDLTAKWALTIADTMEVFQKKENRSGRVTPGFSRQFGIVYSRLCKQQFRSMRILFQDYVILLITGAALGLLSPTNDSQLGGVAAYNYTIIAVSLLGMIAGLRTFNQDTLNFYRESASGINRLAYFLAKDLSDWPHILLKPIFYMALFYFFNDPRSTFASNVGLTICLMYCVTGVAYVLATLMPPSSSQLAAAVVTLIASVIAGKGGSHGIMKALYALSFARWALEAYVIANFRRYSGVWLLTRCAYLQHYHYSVKHYGTCIAMLIFFGVLARWGAFMLLIMLHRDKQK